MNARETGLVDGFGRRHTYLRLSVTDRCNFRCTYCMPEEGIAALPRSEVLSFEEIERLVRVFAGLGIRKVRLTGGEPTARRGVVELVRRIAAIPGIAEVAMTTNGHLLERLAGPLAEAGLRRVNVSLDTLRPDRFAALTRGGDLARVLRGIAAARAAGLAPISLNAVLVPGFNDDELDDLVAFAAAEAATTRLRFIEYMPFDGLGDAAKRLTAEDIRARIARRRPLRPAGGERADAGPAREWIDEASGLRIGFISPLSSRFCADCNRLRLLADGRLRACLAHEQAVSLRDALRAGASDAELAERVRAAVGAKPEGHGAHVDGGVPFEGVMTRVGG